MIFILFVLHSLNLSFNASATAAEFSAEACENQEAVTREVIELELAGTRWQGGKSDCLKQDKFKTVVVTAQELGTAELLDPEYLSKGEVKIIKQKWIDSLGAMQVEFAYIAEKRGYDGKREPANVTDRLTYKVNLGKKREKYGCASILDEPVHFVMRKECHHE